MIYSLILLLLGLAAWSGMLTPRHNSQGLDHIAEAVSDWDYPGDLEYITVDGVSLYQKSARANSLTGGGVPGKQVLFYGQQEFRHQVLVRN